MKATIPELENVDNLISSGDINNISLAFQLLKSVGYNKKESINYVFHTIKRLIENNSKVECWLEDNIDWCFEQVVSIVQINISCTNEVIEPLIVISVGFDQVDNGILGNEIIKEENFNRLLKQQLELLTDFENY